MVEVALDKHLIPDLANIVLEYCQLEHVDEVIDGCRRIYTMLFGKRHGEFKLNYLTGELMCTCRYVNGKLHGEYKSYYQTGEQWYSHHYVNGELHGVSKCYSPTGELQYSYRYANGVLQ